jgi:hypothetical protein
MLQVRSFPQASISSSGCCINSCCCRYCNHQLRDVLAVAQGLRPLLSRERDKLAASKKTAKDSRRDEWDGTTGRPPTHTAEHHLHASTKLTDAASTRQPGPKGRTTPTLQSQISSHAVVETVPSAAAEIHLNGLPNGSVVECRNDTNDDKWLRNLPQNTVTRHTSHVTHRTSHVTRRTSHVTRHTSHVTCNMSHVTRHTSHVQVHAKLRRHCMRSCRSQQSTPEIGSMARYEFNHKN